MGKIQQRLQNTYKYELLGSMRKNVVVPVKANKTQPPKVLIKKISEEGKFFLHDKTRLIRLDSIVKKTIGIESASETDTFWTCITLYELSSFIP